MFDVYVRKAAFAVLNLILKVLLYKCSSVHLKFAFEINLTVCSVMHNFTHCENNFFNQNLRHKTITLLTDISTCKAYKLSLWY